MTMDILDLGRGSIQGIGSRKVDKCGKVGGKCCQWKGEWISSGKSGRIQINKTHNNLLNVTLRALSSETYHTRSDGYFLYLPQFMYDTYLYLWGFVTERTFLDYMYKHIEKETCFSEVRVVIFHFYDQM